MTLARKVTPGTVQEGENRFLTAAQIQRLTGLNPRKPADARNIAEMLADDPAANPGKYVTLAQLINAAQVTGKDVDEGDLDGVVVLANYAGISISISTFALDPDEIFVVRGVKQVLMGSDVALWFEGEASGWRREEVLSDVLHIFKHGPPADPDSDLQTLTPTGDDMAKYTVGESKKKAVSDRARQERKERLGLAPKPDRIQALAADARSLLTTAGTMDEMTETQFVTFTKRRIDLARKALALQEELELVMADIELVEFACDEADAK